MPTFDSPHPITAVVDIDGEISVPGGSELRVEGGVADLRSSGTLDECSVKAGVGTVDIDRAGPLRCKTGAGAVTVREAVGHTEITTGSGEVRIGLIDGTGVLKSANGDIWVGTATGDLRVKAANGRVRVDRRGPRRQRLRRHHRPPLHPSTQIAGTRGAETA